MKWFDRYVGRWMNVCINVGLTVLFATVALFLEHGWARDLWWFAAGANFGYAAMWLMYPRFTKARQREMEAEMALIAASTLHRMTSETLASIHRIAREEEDKEPRRLQ